MTTASSPLRSPCVVRSPNWLGDAVMSLPAVRNLKTILREGKLTVAAPEKIAALWEACPFVDEVIALTDAKSILDSARQLRAGKFGSTVLLPNSLRAAAEAALAFIPQRIGYARNGRNFLLSKCVPVPPRNPARLHQRFYYLHLVAALQETVDETMPGLRIPPAAPGRREKSYLALCPGAEYGPSKRWPVDRFAAVGKELAERHGLRLVLFGASGDAPVAAELATLLPAAENRVGQTSLAEFMSALASAKLVICNDSGAMHLASALGTPTVAIFGSTEPLMTGPLGRRTAVLRHHVPCSPCFLRECPIDFACMTSITPKMGVAAAETLVDLTKV